ncbi:MAG: hypothetical protein ABSA48_10710 [Terracidiphilus sp.]|jgi:hypothetical protein
MAAAIEADGMGADGSKASGLATTATLESTALSSPVDGFAASSAQRLNAGIRKMANAAVAIILALNLIVASRTARRDHPKSQRRVNSTL